MDKPRPKYSLLMRLIRYALVYRVPVLLALLCMLLYGTARTAVAWVTKEAVTEAMAIGAAAEANAGPAAESTTRNFLRFTSFPNFISVILIVGAGITLIGLVLFAAEYGSQYYAGYLTSRVLIDIRCQLCKQMLGMSISFFDDRRNGDLISRLTNDISVTNTALRLLFGSVIKQGLMLLICVTGMFILDWRLTVAVLLLAPVLGYVIRKLGRRVHQASRENLENFSELTDEMSQIFSGIRVVKAYNMEEREIEEFNATSEELFSAQLKLVRARAASRAFTSGFSHIALGVAACCGLFLLYRGYIEAPALAAFLTLVATIYRPLKTVSRAWNDVNEALAALERIFGLCDLRPDVSDSADARPLPQKHTGVRFSNVSFAYNGEEVLKNIDFQVSAGELVAIVGHSGAGKSTLLDLIARFYDPTSGSVQIDGIDLHKVKRESLVERVAFVSQQTFLFNSSFEENIRYARPDATMEEVIQAAKIAHVHDFIQGQPEGYQTLVGEQGVRLSGGQRQRISLARAFLKKAAILILDEATSELDSETEAAIHDSIRSFAKGRTVFLVAHRLSAVRNADRIIVLERGRIVEMGRHEELMKRSGPYTRLYHVQFPDAVPGSTLDKRNTTTSVQVKE